MNTIFFFFFIWDTRSYLFSEFNYSLKHVTHSRYRQKQVALVTELVPYDVMKFVRSG